MLQEQLLFFEQVILLAQMILSIIVIGIGFGYSLFMIYKSIKERDISYLSAVILNFIVLGIALYVSIIFKIIKVELIFSFIELSFLYFIFVFIDYCPYIIPGLIAIISAIALFLSNDKNVSYVQDQDGKIIRLGKYISIEISDVSGFLYKYQFIGSNGCYFDIYSSYTIDFIREHILAFELSIYEIPETERVFKERVKKKGSQYKLFRILCFLIPFCHKLKLNLYLKLPKEETKNETIQIITIRHLPDPIEHTLDRAIRQIENDYQEIKQEFEINEYITLKLIGKETRIYINNKYFQQCKFLLLNIPEKKIEDIEDLNSIDEISEYLDKSLEPILNNKQIEYNITPEEEFQGHCSNLQAWYENEYDTRLLHRNLAFPLLKELTEAGDPLAKKVFKEEIASRLGEGYEPVITYLIDNNYLKYFDKDECEPLLDDSFYFALKKRILSELYSITRRGSNLYLIQLSAVTNIKELLLREFFKRMQEKEHIEIIYTSDTALYLKYRKHPVSGKAQFIIFDDTITGFLKRDLEEIIRTIPYLSQDKEKVIKEIMEIQAHQINNKQDIVQFIVRALGKHLTGSEYNSISATVDIYLKKKIAHMDREIILNEPF